jgi:hypothetical protein
MPDLRLESFVLPAAALGPENPLPQFLKPRAAPLTAEDLKKMTVSPGAMSVHALYRGCLPYLLQDGYGRDRPRTPLPALTLENDRLRATFLPGLGGRLWSLVDKRADRELLYSNPVFQPGNLAVRGAWMSGGIEWNAAVWGHSPLTCAPVFAARVRDGRGNPVLRIYEWERIRRVPYQIDFSLPDGSDRLLVHVRLVNPHDESIPMYWWSNIAAPEAPDVRVLVPAEKAWHYGYQVALMDVPVPEWDGVDITRPTRRKGSADFFYQVPPGSRPWIAALDGEGRGLIQTSTARLLGRKLFMWGVSPGGRRWQEFLSAPGRPYIEIQAGLARVQSEYLPMPAGAVWTWTEAYGPIAADPAVSHGADWAAARAEVARRLDAAVPAEWLEARHAELEEASMRPPEEALFSGSGWGALERRRRARAGERPFCGQETPFPDGSIGDAQAPWLALLERGALPDADPAVPPSSYMVQPEWAALLDSAVRSGRGDHWLARLHLGVMRYYAGNLADARAEWEKSAAMKRSAWALRNLAMSAAHEDRRAAAADLLLAARRLAPGLRPLACECLRSLIDAGRASAALALLDELPPALRSSGRVLLLEAQAALDAGDLDRVSAILDRKPVVPDMKEGERSLSDLWFGLHEKRLALATGAPVDDALKARVRREFPPPAEIDFRMSV